MHPLVLLHGFTGSPTNWEPIVRRLRAAQPERPFLTPAIVGHGPGPHPTELDAYRMPAAAEALLTRLPERFHLLGYSMGGRLALFISLTYPQRVASLILESASPGLATVEERTERQARDAALADRILSDGIEKFVAFWEQLPLWASQQRLPHTVRERLRQQRLTNNPQALAHSLRGMGTGVQPNLWPRLTEQARPVLLLTGAEDAKFERLAQQMLSQLPQARHVSLPEAGHTVHLEQPERYATAVLDFLPPT